jgi:hypothetical protein
MRALLTIALFALVAGCNKGPATGAPNGPISGGEPNGPIASGRAAAGNEGNAISEGEAKAAQAGELPAPGPAPRFVGKWAKDQQSCQSAAWQFTDSTLRIPDGVSCSFNRVSPVAGGYDIQATCSSRGVPSADMLQIRFAESAKAMLFSSNSIKDSGLVYCGRDV